ncbi:MAG: acyl-CoA dehydrogenase family protein [Microbacterium sp.]
MDLSYGADAEEFRARLRGYLQDVLPADWQGYGALGVEDRLAFDERWGAELRSTGYFAPAWPKAYGGAELGVLEQAVLLEEFVRRGVPQYTRPNDPFGTMLLGPTLMHWGTDEQKARFFPPTVSGEIRWAQGYSEPEAGSDLFGLRTHAELDGDEWVINGSKIWQTAGPTANWIFALVRTDPAAERSRGISFMLIDAQQPGVEIRGIRNMADEVEFSEVFFTDARTPVENVLGGVGNGARVALTLLGFERGAGGIAAAASSRVELDRLTQLARAQGVLEDPVIRQRIAECHSRVQTMFVLGLKALAAGATGAPPGPESSFTKLMGSEYHKLVTELAIDILGRDALVWEGADSVAGLGAQPLGLDPLSAHAWIDDFLHARPGTVYGGSSEIQRNTIAEQLLGLPREQRGAGAATKEAVR